MGATEVVSILSQQIHQQENVEILVPRRMFTTVTAITENSEESL